MRTLGTVIGPVGKAERESCGAVVDMVASGLATHGPGRDGERELGDPRRIGALSIGARSSRRILPRRSRTRGRSGRRDGRVARIAGSDGDAFVVRGSFPRFSGPVK